jgi:predicted nucleic acid-binding protein
LIIHLPESLEDSLRAEVSDGRFRVLGRGRSRGRASPYQSEEAAELAGRIAGDLERSGQTIGIADPMIAVIALTNGLELVTGNTAHFQRVQQLGHPWTLRSWRV